MLPDDFSFEGLIDIYQRDYDSTVPWIRTGVTQNEFMRKVRNGANPGLINLEIYDWVQFMNFWDTEYDTMTVIDACQDDDYNGLNFSWTAVWTATDISYSTTNFVSGNSSITFNTTATTDPFGITKTYTNEYVDITSQNYILMQAFFPEFTQSVTVRLGNDSSNYYYQTLSTDWQGNHFTAGWHTLLVTIDEMLSVTAGAIDDATLGYFAYIIDSDITTPPSTNWALDAVYICPTYGYDIKYYSSSVITDSFGTRRPMCLPTGDSDILIINEQEYTLFLKQFSTIAAIDVHPDSGISEYNAYSGALQKWYENFRINFPSQKILISTDV